MLLNLPRRVSGIEATRQRTHPNTSQMNLFEAWTLWTRGHLTEDAVLWGIKLLWWARIGKLLQCAAGVTILAEIIGPERLRLFGNSLHGKFTLAGAGKYFRAGLLWYRAMFTYAFLTGSGTPAEKAALQRTSQYYPNKINVFVGMVVTGIGWYFLRNGFAWWLQLIAVLIGYCIAIVTLSPIVTIVSILLLLSLGVLVDSLIIEPTAWILERPALDRWTKVLALLLLLIGFHFDFLTS